MKGPSGHELPVASQELVDALPAPVFVVQRQRFVYVNAAFTELMALDASELIGRDSLERVHPDDRNVVPHGRSASSEPYEHQSAAQVRVRRGDGAERSLVVTTVPITYNGGSALLGTLTDITLQPDVLNV